MSNNDKLSVRIRMYRQGLGDCFLLTFTRGQEVFNMMIDCGLFFMTQNGADIMKRVATNIQTTTQNRVDAVVLTHDHYDHTSGFDLAKKVFQDENFKLNEVWVGWTEDESHEKYTLIRDHFRNILKGLRMALNDELTKTDESVRKVVNSLVNDFFGVGAAQADALAADGTGFSKTWDYILNDKAEEVRYFRPGTFHELENLGIRIYILGPPEDIGLIESEVPPTDETYRPAARLALASSFLAAATTDDSLFKANSFIPFDRDYRIELEAAKNYRIKTATDENYPFFEKHYGFNDTEENRWRRIDDEWLATASDLALWMDDFTNNTCLALAIELIESKKVLIFPGDAQFGNWISWQKLTWEVPDKNGIKRKVTMSDLFANTIFYKVGHHGSHNATLRRSGLELMNTLENDLVAMIPTNRDFAKTQGNKEKGGWQMPEEELFIALKKRAKGRVILADEVGSENDEKKPLKDRCKEYNLSNPKTTNFLKSVNFSTEKIVRDKDHPEKTEPLYVEYILEG